MSNSPLVVQILLRRRSYRRITSMLAAAAFLWVATLATLHALGHALNGPEPVCSVCLAADHVGQGLAPASAPVSATAYAVAFHPMPTSGFRSIFRAVYASRAPPALSATQS